MQWSITLAQWIFIFFKSKVFIQNCKFSVFIQSINTQEQYIFQNLLHSHMWNFSQKVLRILKIIHTCTMLIYTACVNIAFILDIIIYLYPPKEQIPHNLLHLHAALHHITTIILEPAKVRYALQHFLCKAHNKWQWVHVWKNWRSSFNILVIIT